MMRFGSLFAGIGGFDLGFAQANMICEWQVEIDSHCKDVLKKQFPEVERYDDVREIKGNELKSVDLISGGFPCQDVSVAGRRKGLAGKRSGLWFEFHRILEEAHPRWAIIENVPGLLSSNGGQDFAIILRGLANLGYGVAYRILDAQHFGVAQRRRRVFIIGSLGDYSSIEILFESESLQRNSKARREKRKVAPTIPASGAGTSRTGNQRTEAEMMVITPAITGSSYKADRPGAEGLAVADTVSSKWHKGSGGPAGDEVQNLVASPLRSRNSPNSNMPGRGGEDDENIVLALHENQRAEVRMSEQAPELTTGGGKPGQGYPAVLSQGVRRLTPTECERLQGFPDGWTEGNSDTQRYKMIGNAVCVPVAKWIGKRIIEFDKEKS